MMFWYGNGMNGWGWGLMTFSSIVFWALAVFVVVLLVRHFWRGSQRPPMGPPQYGPSQYGPPPGQATSGAEQLLAERYARGEIDDEEYHRRLATLRGTGAAAGPASTGQANSSAGQANSSAGQASSSAGQADGPAGQANGSASAGGR